MAAPITHIVLAKEFLRRYPVMGDSSGFILGVSFPDIRYLGVIARNDTHISDVRLQHILNESDAFAAGMKHHVLVDLVREKFIRVRDVYSSAPKSKYITQAIKLFEDEMLYGRVNEWKGLAATFENLIDQERAFPIAEDDLHRWHALLREYVLSAPSPDSRRRFIIGIGFTDEIAQEIEGIIGLLKNNELMCSAIHDMYQDFTSMLSQWPEWHASPFPNQ